MVARVHEITAAGPRFDCPTQICGVCGVDSDAVVLVQNGYGDWLCLHCNEWVFLMTIEPRDRDAMEFTPDDVARACMGDEPWMHGGYVPEGAETLS